MRRIMIGVCVLLAFVAGSVAAQNLLDNDAYKKSIELQQQAQAAFDNGNYAQSTQLSQEAKSYAQQALTIAQEQALAYRATNWLDLAKVRIQYASGMNVPTRYPDVWKSAQDHYSTAQSTYAAKQYEPSIAASQAVVAALHGILAQATLPKYYVVRLIPQRRDCFWRIAEYPFVYGDPLKWPLLYQANKAKLQDPSNPNLIQPGLVVEIPSVKGEVRAGTWKP